MQSCLDFFSLPFFSSPFWQGIGGPLVGGLVGGLFAVVAQMLANNAQRKRDRISEHEALRSVLKAIKTEVEVYQSENLNTIAQTIEERENIKERGFNPGPLALTRIARNPFIVFDSNAAQVGRLSDDDLRKNIVSGYGVARAFVDILNFNTSRVQFWYDAEMAGERSANAQQIQFRDNELNRLETMITNGFPKHRRQITDLVAAIERYLSSRASVFQRQ
jgi:hypothetical protein